NERKLIAAVDCTGHGVPGAFMSMIGNAFLNEIVNERGIVEPHTVLDHLRNNVVKSMRQTGAEGENKDGMDIALCAFDEKQMMLEFSGANNPLWLFRNGELKEFAGDKQPIGVQTGRQDPFTLQKVPLQKGDRIYIFTDGYADQFGGPKGKKFKYKQLQQLLINMEGSPMSEQEKDLQHELEKWKGELEQVDDILVIGIRI
ncbi:MAG TPA: SpoIIE family protein phosphatase, partial [Bacteroidia bacterium]